MNLLMIILRLVHLFSAFIWLGTTFTMLLFIGPTAQAVGADAQKFMRHFIMRSGLAQRLSAVGGLTVLTGLLMYGYLFRGIAPLNTGVGLALTVGGVFGILSLVNGLRMGRLIKSMRKIAGEVAGGAPKPEQLAELGQLQTALTKAGALNAVLMSIALIGMTLSEYFAI